MPECMVTTCKNYYRLTKGTNVKYFRFPREEEMIKKWLDACGAEKFNSSVSARVCSKHFDESSYEIPLKHRLLQYNPKSSRYLKPDAVPNLNLPSSSQVSGIKTEEDGDGTFIGLSMVKIEPQSPAPSDDETSQGRIINTVETDILRVGKNQKEINRLRTRIKKLENEKKMLLRQVKEVEEATCRRYEKALSTIFTPGQIKKLLDIEKVKKVRWSLHDIASASRIYSVSPSCYKYLRSNNYPFPDKATLRKLQTAQKKTSK